MRFLLDTNVVSEFAKDEVNPGILRWLSHGDEQAMVISVVTIGEIEMRTGVKLLNPWS